MQLNHLSLFLIALVVTIIMTPLARKIAWRLDAVDRPSSRRINKKTTPRMGGIAVFCGIVAAVALQLFGTQNLGWPMVFEPAPHFKSMNYGLVALGFAAVFVTGALDDVYQLQPWQKFLGQLLAAGIAVSGGLIIGTVVNPFNGGPLYLGWLAYPITVVYLVAYMNIFNLIDGLDGLATGIAGIAAFTMFVLSLLSGRMDAAALAISLVGAAVGFLFYNFHPASIFLGDSGSLLIGYTLGTITLLSVTRIAGLTTIIIPLVIAAVPIIDTFSAIVRRMRAHVSIGQADRGHIHHRLIDEGFDQRQAVLLIYGWTFLLCLGTFVMTQVNVVPRIIIFVLLLVFSALFTRRLHLFRPVLLHHKDPRTGDDELVCQDDPEFEEAEEEFEEKEAERHHHRL